jgi:hypothetical protein
LMARPMCVLERCEEPRHAKLLCLRHYARWRSGGDAQDLSPREKTTTERFWEKVDLDGECWLWLGMTNGEGYGRFWDGEEYVPAHRHALRERRGYPVRDDLQVDHLCGVTSCVRPEHLEPVTAQVNSSRRGRRCLA